jgi:hypothetical protein
MNYSLSQIIPATRFVRWFSKYASQLKEQGHFLILKDNEPLAVMIDPAQLEYYESLLERMEDAEDILIAEQRLATNNPSKNIKMEDIIWK